MTSGTSLKRAFPQTIIATLIGAALIGFYVVLFGTFGRTEAKILGTTLTIRYFGTTSLVRSSAFEKNRRLVLSLSGLALGVLGLAFFIPSFASGQKSVMKSDEVAWGTNVSYTLVDVASHGPIPDDHPRQP